MAPDMGKLQKNKEYHLANNLKKRCIKREFTGIHDRFLRDHFFRERMLENSRDEEVCRAWDVLADEDHTYYMAESEYFYYRNKWWISLNKSGNDTQPVRNVLTSTKRCLHETVYTKKLVDDNSGPYLTGSTNNGNRRRVLPPLGGMVVFLRIQRESTKEEYDRTVRPVFCRSLAKTSDEWLSRVHSILLQMDRLQLTAVYCDRREV